MEPGPNVKRLIPRPSSSTSHRSTGPSLIATATRRPLGEMRNELSINRCSIKGWVRPDRFDVDIVMRAPLLAPGIYRSTPADDMANGPAPFNVLVRALSMTVIAPPLVLTATGSKRMASKAPALA